MGKERVHLPTLKQRSNNIGRNENVVENNKYLKV
jgi:hypothetical protein